MRADARDWLPDDPRESYRIVRKDTGEVVQKVVWADTDTALFGVLRSDADGNLVDPALYGDVGELYLDTISGVPFRVVDISKTPWPVLAETDAVTGTGWNVVESETTWGKTSPHTVVEVETGREILVWASNSDTIYPYVEGQQEPDYSAPVKGHFRHGDAT